MDLHRIVLEKSASQRFIDSNGKPIREGSYVQLLQIPPGLLEDLPLEDQEAITRAATKPLLVSELMVDFKEDDIELQFIAENGTIHFIYVAGKYLQVK